MDNTGTNSGTGSAPPRDYPVIDAVAAEIKNILRCFEPDPGVAAHFRNARVEVLKGVRQMIDNRIERLSRSGAQTGQKITVE
ncbi:MAG TPA: hypothetical protein VFA04_18080 [Bryobacteraceae bacterium]|jgi:hypothetical protein|nr:hypothetical protein [Bryobacteraceae bacterium]